MCQQEGPWVGVIDRRHPGAGSVAIKPETRATHGRQLSGSRPSCLPPGTADPASSSSAHLLPPTSHFSVLDNSPLWKVPLPAKLQPLCFRLTQRILTLKHLLLGHMETRLLLCSIKILLSPHGELWTLVIRRSTVLEIPKK